LRSGKLLMKTAVPAGKFVPDRDGRRPVLQSDVRADGRERERRLPGRPDRLEDGVLRATAAASGRQGDEKKGKP